MTIHHMKLSEPWFSLIKSGQKTIEGRIYDDKRKLLQVGDTIIFTNQKMTDEIVREILDLKIFTGINSFDSALRHAKLKNILPGVKTYAEGVQIYHSIPGYEDGARDYGVILIYI